jgi:hypothetical protein
MAKMSPKMKKAYSAYEKSEAPKEKMMEAKKGAAMKKKSMIKKMGKKK